MVSAFCGRFFPATGCCLSMLIIAMFTSCQNVQTQHSETQPKPMPETTAHFPEFWWFPKIRGLDSLFGLLVWVSVH